MSNNSKNKIIAILGTTASGKTGLAVKLAHKFGGEIVSADSRQVYKYMDVGSGKDLHEYNLKIKNRDLKFKTVRIPYHCIDLVDPKTEYNLAKFYRDASKAISDILDREKLPIIAGGTGLYAQAVIDGFLLSSSKPDKKKRRELENKSVEELLSILKKQNKNLVKELSNSEKNNKRRLIRRIEILSADGKTIKIKPIADSDFLLLGLTWPREILRERIAKRLEIRIKNEKMIEEVERLHAKHNVSWKRLEGFGLEYKFVSLYLQKKIDYKTMVSDLNTATAQFAKRQMNWLRRWERQGAKIHWVNPGKEPFELVEKFLK